MDYVEGNVFFKFGLDTVVLTWHTHTHRQRKCVNFSHFVLRWDHTHWQQSKKKCRRSFIHWLYLGRQSKNEAVCICRCVQHLCVDFFFPNLNRRRTRWSGQKQDSLFQLSECSVRVAVHNTHTCTHNKIHYCHNVAWILAKNMNKP